MRGKARLIVKEGRFVIILGPSQGEADHFSAWERFLIAHELGHTLLEKHGAAKPLGESEYWKFEQLCDSFARWLLLPRTHLEQAARLTNPTVSDRLELSMYLQSKWDIPWEVAAFELSDYDRNVYFLRLKDEVEAFRVTASTLPNKKLLGTRLKPTSRLVPNLRSLSERAKASLVDNVSFEADFGLSFAEAAVIRVFEKDFRMALLRPEREIQP